MPSFLYTLSLCFLCVVVFLCFMCLRVCLLALLPVLCLWALLSELKLMMVIMINVALLAIGLPSDDTLLVIYLKCIYLAAAAESGVAQLIKAHCGMPGNEAAHQAAQRISRTATIPRQCRQASHQPSSRCSSTTWTHGSRLRLQSLLDRYISCSTTRSSSSSSSTE